MNGIPVPALAYSYRKESSVPIVIKMLIVKKDRIMAIEWEQHLTLKMSRQISWLEYRITATKVPN